MTAPAGQTIEITFNQFDVEEEFGCIYDWVVIVDGDGSELFSKSCGSQIPDKIESNTNLAILVFFSDYEFTRNGFQADLSDYVKIEVLNEHFLIIGFFPALLK